MKTGDGLTALLVNEISVRGVLQSKGSLIAMVQAPDKKTYVIHQGDRFADGVVKAVTTQGLVIVQDVNDPLSLVKQREVRKLLRELLTQHPLPVGSKLEMTHPHRRSIPVGGDAGRTV